MGRSGSGVEVRDNSIRLSFVYEGKPVRRTLMLNGKPLAPTAANTKYAHRLAAEIRERIRHGTFSLAEYFPVSGNPGRDLTVGDQLDCWLAAQRVEASTKAGYQSAIRFWKAAIGTIQLRQLRTSDVLAVIAARADLSGKTINNYTDVLRDAMHLAVLDKVLTENPTKEVERAKHQKEPPDPFEPAERERIITDVHDRYPEQVSNLVEFWFWTGLRTSEIFGLRWQRIDFAKGIARIAEANVRGTQKQNTKTNVERDVKLNSRALAAITRQKAHTFLADGFVFADPRYGKPWEDERAFRRSFWTPALKRLGIRYRRPYNMRHTYATQMLMTGMNDAFCARQLGHSVEVFHRTYAKWLDGIQDDQEMARLESAIGAAAESATIFPEGNK